jgi:hypothetical protein
VVSLLADIRAVPVVGALAYREALAGLPSRFTARLRAEPGNRYNLGAIAVYLPDGAKVGYVAPDIARHMASALDAAARGSVSCPAALTAPGAHLDVRLLLDVGSLGDLDI